MAVNVARSVLEEGGGTPKALRGFLERGSELGSLGSAVRSPSGVCALRWRHSVVVSMLSLINIVNQH